MSAQSDHWPMDDRNRRLQRALRILKEREGMAERPYNRARLKGSEIDRHRTRLDIAAAVIREERQERQSA